MRKFKLLSFTLIGALILAFQNCSVGNSPSGNSSAASVQPGPGPRGGASLSVVGGTLSEGQSGNVTVAIENMGAAGFSLLWDLTKEDGSPATSDFSVVSGYVDVPANASQAVIALNSLNDNVYEIPDKRFLLKLREANGRASGSGVISVTGIPFKGSVSTAGDSSCGAADQVVKCWGANASGQLGNGSTSNANAPVAVAGLPMNASVRQVAVGSSGFACALLSTGAVYCWGNNGSGQLGLGAAGNRTSATAVPMLDAGVTALSAGSSHACAIKAGALYCWGLNTSGQLGTGDSTNRMAPVLISAVGTVTSVSAGLNFTCAVANGAVKCWGLGTSGQLGNATTASSLVPVAVLGAEAGVSSVSAGSTHACALIGDAIKCWGANASGQLGDGTTVNKSIATVVSNLGTGSGVTSLSAGLAYTCAIVKGVPYCWGLNAQGQVGTPAGTNRNMPAPVAAALTGGFLRISAALEGQQTCAMAAPKAIHCWGQGTSGQLGIGSVPTTGAPSATPIGF